ncbi:hypothetical protein SLI_7074 [Streptomyces lividans 1326]|uniref:Uncharacterized protein n=1 Tax=Streptomyces lividans 1326 TaxID=1200984 RepID=A0A7U9HEE1_STRLI|nr:hypothetical protein SLI_7074 [Streptomyces lividans 1326]
MCGEVLRGQFADESRRPEQHDVVRPVGRLQPAHDIPPSPVGNPWVRSTRRCRWLRLA